MLRQNLHPLCFCFSGQEQCFRKVQSRSGKVDTNVQLYTLMCIVVLKKYDAWNEKYYNLQ